MSAGVPSLAAADEACPAAEARGRLVEAHLGLVARLARYYQRRVQGSIVDLDDLIQEGTLGLLQAAERFDQARGCAFSTYAVPWVRREILRALANQGRTIRLPARIWRELQGLAQARQRLWQEHAREPAPAELAAALACERERVLFLLQVQQEVLSLEQPFSGAEEDTCLADLLAAPDTSGHEEQQATVTSLLRYLSAHERQVIIQRYQLGSAAEQGVEDIPLPYSVVARRLRMTAEHVKTVEARALLKMRFWAEREQLGAGRAARGAQEGRPAW